MVEVLPTIVQLIFLLIQFRIPFLIVLVLISLFLITHNFFPLSLTTSSTLKVSFVNDLLIVIIFLLEHILAVYLPLLVDTTPINWFSHCIFMLKSNDIIITNIIEIRVVVSMVTFLIFLPFLLLEGLLIAMSLNIFSIRIKFKWRVNWTLHFNSIVFTI